MIRYCRKILCSAMLPYPLTPLFHRIDRRLSWRSPGPAHAMVLAAGLLLSACGGAGSEPGPTPSPTPSPTPTPPPATDILNPVAGAARALPADFNSYNFNVLRVAADMTDPVLVAGLRALNPGSLRIPGGTLGEYWDWSRGGIRVGPYPGLPEAAPFSADIRAITGLTPMVVDRLLDAVGTPALFTTNMLTASLDENLADIAQFRSLGQAIGRIELGNEEYFRLPNPAARFPTARSYGETALAWATRLRTDLPGAKLAVIAPSPLRNTGISFADWMAGLDAANVWPAIDAVAIHPYFDTTALRPLASPAAGEAMIAAILAHDDDYLQRVIARLPAGKTIWVTEWNMFEDEANAVTGGSWLAGIANLARAINFMANPRVDLSALHVAVGNRQWSALTGADGRALSFDNGRPVIVTGPPFALTATGETLALLGDATQGGVTAQRLDFGTQLAARPLLGARLADGSGRVRLLLVNGTSAAISVRASGRATQLVGVFDRGTVMTGTLSRTSFDITGDRIDLPAFSATLIRQ